MTPQVDSSQPTAEPGYLIGGSLIAILIGLLIAVFAWGPAPGPVKEGSSTVLLGAYVFAWGLMFLASYYYGHKTFFLRALLWMCEHWSHPKGRKMAFFYFGLATLIGGGTMLRGLGVF